VIHVSVNRVSKIFVLYIGQSMGCIITSFQSKCIGRRCLETCKWRAACQILKLRFKDSCYCILENTEDCTATWTHTRTIGRLSRQTWLWQHHYNAPKMNVNGAATTFGLGLHKMPGLCSNVNPELNYQPPFSAKFVVTTSQLYSQNLCQWSINNFSLSIQENAWAVPRH
jgi:hypothetical protein